MRLPRERLTARRIIVAVAIVGIAAVPPALYLIHRRQEIPRQVK